MKSASSRLATAARLVCASLLVFATGGPSVDAQDESAAAFFRADRARMQAAREAVAPVARVRQRPIRMNPHAAPVRTRVRPSLATPARRRDATPTPSDPATPAPIPNAPLPDVADGAQPGNTAPSQAAVPAPAEHRVEPTFSIAVMGDSLGVLLFQGLAEAFADKPEVAVVRKARENTGLVRDDYFDWVKGAREVANAPDKPNLAVMILGSNDRQQLRDASGSADLRSTRWTEAYGDRVEAIAQMFSDRKIPLIWVGLPIMKSERFSADMAAINEIYKQRAVKAGAVFVDTWEAFQDDRGQYAAYGPDVNGQYQKLRSADGVHFTRPGARKLAYFLESDVRGALSVQRPKVEPLDAANAVIAARPSTASPSEAVRFPPAPADGLVRLPLPPAAPQILIPVKPAEGAIVALTSPALSPGGQLASAAAPGSPGGPAQALLDRVIVQGQPLPARPGRADDFTWPRP